MSQPLTLSVGQHTDRGRKAVNQDCHGMVMPRAPLASTKGAALALADGISSSAVSHIASATAVAAFLDDYYATADAWSVRTSAERVLAAVNAWLYAQTRQGQDRADQDCGHVCTFSALVIKSNTAHLFHVGDARIYRVHAGGKGASLEQLTTDHRVWVSPERSYLSRALGVQDRIEIDYRAVALEAGDLFMLATDGVYEHVSGADVHAALQDAPDLDAAACRLVERALANGSADNLTVQLVRIESLQAREASELLRQMAGLPLPPLLAPRAELDGYRIVREVHGSSRSHVYLAEDPDSGAHVILKTPSIDLAGDRAYMERFVMEEWIMGRVRSPHVVKPASPARRRSHVYVATEYIEGVTLAQWLRSQPRPGLDAVRRIVDQVAKGLRALHRLEMLHQDVRPENVMIDADGNARIIDFGSVSVAGVVEMSPHDADWTLQGAALYAAPEYFLGERGTVRSDVFALGVLTYFMLTGELPYGVEIPCAAGRAAQRRLAYTSAREHDPAIPAWVDAALRKALQIDPRRRYEDVAEFVYDLHHPNSAFAQRTRTPLIERNPLLFWKAVAFGLGLVLVADLALRV
ncbi:bifunctional protein-serine/threonine kinase/phosphatase [Telluria mixta]|uniref:Bifunctional protein-serine/threonine kinase/phosphatase n=1 Tax=Telluria mixta TaxID=34071 RepID=A0ABT2BZD0_9BURK|nr:bifunctional protein-serine/threonine kinase/phosphatase [Telluria mixta]MCS0630302.1 bifunctional protein-serine/threonine kinase/phosphatase [Telluria mixta]WEM94389.1 bifunctional protein-serine/threonine kinase/phosphatase [Telluria mixta]